MSSDKQIKLFALVRSRALENVLSRTVKGIEGVQLETLVTQASDFVPRLHQINGVDAILLDLNFGQLNEIDKISRILDEHDSPRLIVTTPATATVGDIRHLVQMGISDVLPQPISQGHLAEAIERLKLVPQKKDGPGKHTSHVISVIKGRGGVGATMLSVQMACSFTEDRIHKGKVCLIDLDLQSGNAALYLDVDSEFSIADLLASQEKFDGQLLRGMMASHETGVDVLVAPKQIIPLEAIGPKFIERLFKVLRKEYQYIVIDLPQAWTIWKREALMLSDHVMLIMQMTVGSIRESRRQLETLQMEGLESTPLSIVANRYERSLGNHVRIKDAETALMQKFDYFISNDYPMVSYALAHGLPLREVDNGHIIEKEIRRIIRGWTNDSGEGASVSKHRWSWFKRSN